MPGISQKRLSVTPQGLVRDGLAARRVEPTVPPAVHYRLTDLGLSLEGSASGDVPADVRQAARYAASTRASCWVIP
jgi:DNA-binding HxlR family transcriptional regulator